MNNRIIAASLLVVFLLSGCGSAPVSAVRYSSAQQVVAALSKKGIKCTGADYSGSPVVSGAASETSCYLNGGNTEFFIDVFQGTVTTAMVLKNSASTGSEKIWSDVGPNWWVQTTRAYAMRIRRALGGRTIGGSWNPQQSATPPPGPLAVWQSGQGYALYQVVTAAMHRTGTDASAGAGAALSADGKALYRAALAALKVPCPADKNGYKLEMDAFAAAGIALEFNKLSLAEKYIKTGEDMTSSVNAACGF